MQRLLQLISRASYLRKSMGLGGVAKLALTRLVGPVYRRHEYYIANHYIDMDSVPEEAGPKAGEARGVVVDSTAAFDAIRDRLHPHFSAADLRNFIAGSPKRFLILAEYCEPDCSLQYVGYRSCEQGAFSVQRARQSGRISDEIMMIFNNEVAPDFRGKGITQQTRPGMYRHCKRIGVNRTTSVIPVYNISSIRAHMKPSAGMMTTLNGRITCVEWLGGRVVRKTPWNEVKAMIERPPQAPDSPRIMQRASKPS